MIVYNAIRCKKCGDVVESNHRHDFNMCSCNTVGADGGKEYLRRIGEKEDTEELSLYSNSSFIKIREVFSRFDPFYKVYVPLKDISNEWLTNILDYYTPPSKGNMSPDYWLLFLREKQHRIDPTWQ